MSEAPRLFLITPRIADAAFFAPVLEAAMGAVDVASVLLRTQVRDDGATKTLVKALAPIVQNVGAALMVEADPRLAARMGADGVHFSGSPIAEAVGALQPERIVGVGGLASRDDAMTAGEAGADYLMFGGPDDPMDDEAALARAAWWAEIFNVPCVVYLRDLGRVREAAATGAEFLAVGEGIWTDPMDVAARLRALWATIQTAGEAAP